MKEENNKSQPTEELENSSISEELTDEDLDQVSGGTKNSVHHISFDGVDGESTHKDHKDDIEILSW